MLQVEPVDADIVEEIDMFHRLNSLYKNLGGHDTSQELLQLDKIVGFYAQILFYPANIGVSIDHINDKCFSQDGQTQQINAYY